MRRVRLSDDDIQTIPLSRVVGRFGVSEEGPKRGSYDKIYGKPSRRQAVAKLREISKNDGRQDRTSTSTPDPTQHYCALNDVLAHRAARIHQHLAMDSLQSSRPMIAPDNNNVSMVRLDVEEVGPSLKTKTNARMAVSKTNGLPVGQTHIEDTSAPTAHDTSNEGMKADVNRIRGYMDLLDEYSLHHFVIWQGKVIRDTPEFTSLARTHQAGWSSIDRCVTILEEIMTVNAVPLAVIDGKQLGDLARFDLERVDEADLCSCIANLEQIRPLLRHTRLVSNAPSTAQLAAVTIQATARRFLVRSDFLLLKNQRNAAVKLQCLARGRRSRGLVAALLPEHRREADRRWHELQAGLKTKWQSWRANERFLVLLPFSGTDERARDLQISRVHWLVDPKVHMICVLPSQPEEDVLEYHRKILEMTGVDNARERMTVVIPENVNLFHDRLPLASLLLYSPGCLKRIVQILKGRPAMILSGEVDWQSKRLAVALGAPLLSAEPALAALIQTQSGMKRVFAAADVSAPLGAHDVYDEEDLMVSLTKLIASHLEVRRWHIKVDVCRGNSGLAVLDTSALTCMAGLKREKAQLERTNGSSGVWHHPDVQLLARARLLKTLRQCLHRVLFICSCDNYPTWAHFLRHLTRVGGVVEAEAPEKRTYPSSSAFISPAGQITFLSQVEILYDACYQHVGCAYPQECVSPHALRGASGAIARELCRRGVIGYVSMHFVAFWDEQAEAPRLWAAGLELGLSPPAFSFCLFRSLTRSAGRGRDLGCYGECSDGSESDQEGQILRYVYLDRVQHRSLRSMRVPVFFKLCRLEGISFDLGTQVGIIFNLVDNMACGVVGMLATAPSRKAALNKARGALHFIRKIAKDRFGPASNGEEPLSKELWSIGQDLQRLEGIDQGRLHHELAWERAYSA